MSNRHNKSFNWIFERSWDLKKNLMKINLHTCLYAAASVQCFRCHVLALRWRTEWSHECWLLSSQLAQSRVQWLSVTNLCSAPPELTGVLGLRGADIAGFNSTVRWKLKPAVNQAAEWILSIWLGSIQSLVWLLPHQLTARYSTWSADSEEEQM